MTFDCEYYEENTEWCKLYFTLCEDVPKSIECMEEDDYFKYLSKKIIKCIEIANDNNKCRTFKKLRQAKCYLERLIYKIIEEKSNIKLQKL